MSSESSHSSGISTQAKEKTTQDEQDQTEQQSQSQQPEHQQESGQDHEQPEAQADEQSQEDELSGEEEDGTEGGLKENTTVFVRSIPFESTEQDIVGFFSQCGTISNVKLLHDPHTRRFKGCCFLRFETAEAANSACQLNETTWMGRKLYISMSLNKQAAPTTSPHVFIGNLDASSDLQSLQEFFSQCGTVLGIKLITDKVTQRNRGFGFVEFADMEAAKKSLELNGTMLGSRPIRIDFQRSKWRPRVSPGAGKAVTNGSGRTLLHRPGGPAGRFSRGHHPVAIASPHHPHPHHIPAPHHPHHHPHHPLHHPHHPHSAPPPPSHPHPHHPHHPPPHHHPHHPHQIPWDPNSVPPAYRAHFPRHPTHFAPPPALLPPASLPLGPNQPSSPASPGSSPTATGTSPTSTGAGGPATGPSAAIGAAGLPSQTGAPTGQGAPNSAMPAASPMAPPPPHAIPHFHPNQPPHRGGHPFFAPPNPFPFYPGYFAMDGGFPGFGYPSFTPDLMSENFEVRDATTPGGPSHKPATSHRSPPAATEAPHIPYQLDPYSHFFPPTTRPIAAPFSPTPYDTPDLVTPK